MTRPLREAALVALADAEPRSFWLDRDDLPDPASALVGQTSADLVVVGGGFTGLWTVLLAKQADPERDVVLLEADRIGHGASGRNGGFVEASLTHGLGNGERHFPHEIAKLVALGHRNLADLEATLGTFAIECSFERTGTLVVATAAHHLDELAAAADGLRRSGEDVELCDRDATRALVWSETYLGGLWQRSGGALVDPGRLALGLRRAVQELGVRLHEHSPVTALVRSATGVTATTALGRVEAAKAVVGTSAYAPPLRRIRRYVLPVYDYVLVTEPLSADQRRAIGWQGRQGLVDSANRFHYYRLTDDGRILWGGYDAVYGFGNAVGPHRDHRFETYALLSRHFFETFPQLEGLRFTHRWGGAIDTSARFTVLFGRAHRNRTAYAVGYTGLGVAATRFGARVALDLVSGAETDLTRLEIVRKRPLPFPPEPLRWAIVRLTQAALRAADEHDGRRGPWLRVLDRVGAGFDS